MAVIWAGVTAVQIYRASDVCVVASAATTVHFGLLAATVLGALVLARRAWLPAANVAASRHAGTVGAVVLLCVAVTLAMRLVELCSGSALLP